MAEPHRDEIAKLEALFAANPEGRIFTPLAEAYRKAGELERAKDTVVQGLERHADYPSAHVVLGRVLWDMGDRDAATSAFRRVLELDPENRVALRSLGDLARDAERPREALEHYRSLLLLDPSDEEVDALAREAEDLLGGAVDDDEDAAPTPADAAASTPTDAAASVSAEDAAPTPADAAAPTAATVPADAGIAGGATDVEMVEGGADAGVVDTADLEAAPVIEGFTATSMADATDPGSGIEGVAAGVGGVGTVGDDPSESVTGAAEDVGPAIDPAELGGFAAGDPGAAGAGGSGVRLDVEGGTVQGAGPESVAGVEGGNAYDAPVVTETMAELYVRQGLYARAAEVYRELLRGRPHDDRFAERLREIEARLAGESAADESEDAGAEPLPMLDGPGADATATMEPATDTIGAVPASMEGNLGSGAGTGIGAQAPADVLGALPAPGGAEVAGAAPERGPGQATIGEYLRALVVFRAGASGATAAPVASQAAGAAEDGDVLELDEGAVVPADEDGVLELDEGAVIEAEGAGGAAMDAANEGAAGPPASGVGEPGGGSAREGPPRREEDEDLEMFRAWLQNLKH